MQFRALLDAYRVGEIGLEKAHNPVKAWIAHAAHGDTCRLRQALFRQVAF